MSWPWRKRAEEQERRAQAAEHRLKSVMDQRATVNRLTEEARRHRELNGFTEMILTVVGESRHGNGMG